MTASIQIPAQEAGPNAPEPGNNAPASTSANPAANNERPSWLPEKFQSPEDFAKSYTELEAKLGSQQTPAPAATEVTEQQLSDGLQAQGLDLSTYQTEYEQNGGLSDESYAKLEKAGYGRQFINDYIKGQEALAAQEAQAIFAEIGGQAEFNKVTAWAKANLPAAEVTAFNRAIETAPAESLKFVISGLHSKYLAANGREPRLVGGEQGGGAGGFSSRYEMTQAMRDPRYRKDENYRNQIQARLAQTNF